MRYSHDMSQTNQRAASSRFRLGYFALAILASAILIGAVFAAWVNNGPQILLTLGSNALAWCF